MARPSCVSYCPNTCPGPLRTFLLFRPRECQLSGPQSPARNRPKNSTQIWPLSSITFMAPSLTRMFPNEGTECFMFIVFFNWLIAQSGGKMHCRKSRAGIPRGEPQSRCAGHRYDLGWLIKITPEGFVKARRYVSVARICDQAVRKGHFFHFKVAHFA